MLAYSRGKVFCYQSMLNHQSVMPCPSSMLYLHLHLKYTDSSSSSMSQIRSSSSSTITETRSVEPPRRNFPRWLRQLEDPAHIPIFSGSYLKYTHFMFIAFFLLDVFLFCLFCIWYIWKLILILCFIASI